MKNLEFLHQVSMRRRSLDEGGTDIDDSNRGAEKMGRVPLFGSAKINEHAMLELLRAWEPLDDSIPQGFY